MRLREWAGKEGEGAQAIDRKQERGTERKTQGEGEAAVASLGGDLPQLLCLCNRTVYSPPPSS